jgi:hypothetical protein
MPLKSQDCRVCGDPQTARTSAFLASVRRRQFNRRGSQFLPAGQETNTVVFQASLARGC